RDAVRAGFEIMVVGVFAEGLGENWLGRIIDDAAIRELELLAAEKGVNVCGEGGEYETLVIDGPNFSKPLRILEKETAWDGARGVLRITKATL
ncbi:MAG: ATP-binding protein, partial [Candidatus Dadabacteria bacterium]|nr:ATP-binding protein [Candidatus Dadabacteria bacterium]